MPEPYVPEPYDIELLIKAAYSAAVMLLENKDTK